MTEPSPSDLPRSKPSTLAAETQKKKKNSRKKSDVKNVEQHVEPKLPDNKLDASADVINYINRLEHDVAVAKKQLKNQRQNFRKAIAALAQHFDSQGISSDIIANYITSLGKREAQVESLDESYEKFYSEYKYQIVQDPKNPALAKPKNKSNKNPTETEPQMLTENNLEKIPKLTGESVSNPEPEAEPQNTDKKKKKSTKEKATTNGETTNEEAPKKRKYQKKPKPTEEKAAVESSPPEIQEIPSFTAGKDSAKNSTKKSAPRKEDTLRSYEEIPQLKQADMKENKQRGDPYGEMGRYLNQMGMDPMSLMNMYMPGINMGMNMGNTDYLKMMQELMKNNVMQNMLNMDQSRQDVFNHYQRNLK